MSMNAGEMREIAVQLNAASHRGDFDAAEKYLTDDYVIIEASLLPYAGTFRGTGALRRLVDLVMATVKVATVELKDIAVGETYAVAVLEMKLSGDGGTVHIMEQMSFRGDKICEIRPYYFDPVLISPSLGIGKTVEENRTLEFGIPLPARILPWPTSISPNALERLIGLGQGETQGQTSAAIPDPTDAEAWRSFVAQINAALLESNYYFGVAERPGVQSETTRMAGVTVYIATPEKMPVEARRRVYLDIHGGGLVYLEGEGCRRGGLSEAERLGVRVVSVDYRVPPDHPYPAALDDCTAVYRELLKEYRPGDIIVGGISGGGSLAGGLIFRARDEGLPLPAALVLLTPEVDLTESGDSFETLLGIDPGLTGKLTILTAAYAPNQDLSHPYLSPLFGDFTLGFPPTFLQTGTRDLFLSNTVRMHRALRKAGVPAELHIWDAMPHGGFRGAPEDDELSAELRLFVESHWHS